MEKRRLWADAKTLVQTKPVESRPFWSYTIQYSGELPRKQSKVANEATLQLPVRIGSVSPRKALDGGSRIATAGDRQRKGRHEVFTLTRKSDYALVAMADLARQAPSTVSAGDMARRLRMPLPALQSIMTRLRRHGFVDSIRGPLGGFRLRKPPEEIMLADLIEVVDGPFRLTRCCRTAPAPDAENCHMEDVCPIREPVRKVHSLLARCLSRVSLAHLTFDRVPVDLGLPEAAKPRQVPVARSYV